MTPAPHSPRRTGDSTGRGRRSVDAPRRAAFDALRQVTGKDAYANLVAPSLISQRQLTGRDAAFVTELVNGTCRMMGSYDLILAAAAGRDPQRLQPAVLDVLRLACHQILSMRVPAHAAVAASVELARQAVGERVTGLVNAICRKVQAHDLDGWISLLSADSDDLGALALRTHHPRWIAEAYAQVLPTEELEAALTANNAAPETCLVVRPGLCTVDELVDAGARRHDSLPSAAWWTGNPGDLAAVRQGRAGVQDAGSQQVAVQLANATAPAAPWLDTCAGPGGKAALLAGLAREQGTWLLASELRPHRAELVRQGLRAYPEPHRPQVICADGTRPAWHPGRFARTMVDVPCTGLGALRRRPEARWRRREESLGELTELQRSLLDKGIEATMVGGVIAYVTCSPHPAETTGVLDSVLARREDVELVDQPVQLWPHRDDTDAMFCALLRRSR